MWKGNLIEDYDAITARGRTLNPIEGPLTRSAAELEATLINMVIAERKAIGRATIIAKNLIESRPRYIREEVR